MVFGLEWWFCVCVLFFFVFVFGVGFLWWFFENFLGVVYFGGWCGWFVLVVFG